MALTAAQLADMQGDLGIAADEAVFTDEELDRLYERADSDYNTAVYLGFRQILAQAAKFHNYTVGQTRVERKQMFDHLRDLTRFWQEEAENAGGNQVIIVAQNPIPPKWKDSPDVDTDTLARQRQPTEPLV